MNFAGARPLPWGTGRRRAAGLPCQGRKGSSPTASPSTSLVGPRRVLTWQGPRVQRPLHRSPAQPGDASGSTGAAPFETASGIAGSAETNGAPPSASLAPSVAPASSAARGSSPITHPRSSSTAASARSSLQSVLTRTYLGEMLFVGIGSIVCGALSYWTVGTSLRRFNPYSFTVVMPEATGVQKGTPLRMKGVPLGSVVSATPMLDRVIVEVEVNEAKTVIPRNAKFELTQSGLIPSPSIDIATPEGVSAEALAAVAAARTAAAKAKSGGGREAGGNSGSAPVAAAAAAPSTATGSTDAGLAERPQQLPRLASPRDVAACRLQGVLVCQGDQLQGQVGGSMDELMAHMLKSLRQGEAESTSAGIVPGRGPLQG